MEKILDHAISLAQVKTDGIYTIPRSYGMYVLPNQQCGSRQYRFGNHPIRQQELIHEFGNCELYQNVVFLQREHAQSLAKLLNNGA